MFSQSLGPLVCLMESVDASTKHGADRSPWPNMLLISLVAHSRLPKRSPSNWGILLTKSDGHLHIWQEICRIECKPHRNETKILLLPMKGNRRYCGSMEIVCIFLAIALIKKLPWKTHHCLHRAVLVLSLLWTSPSSDHMLTTTVNNRALQIGRGIKSNSSMLILLRRGFYGKDKDVLIIIKGCSHCIKKRAM